MAERLIYGKYQVMQDAQGKPARLGAGAFGVTYLAQHIHLHKVVALKVFNSQLLRDDKLRQRFYKEAREQAGLRHNHIATIEYLDEEKGVPYYAVEFCDGGDLRKLIELNGGPLEIGLAFLIIRQATEALAYAHSRGLIHRDIKPSNIMMSVRDGPYPQVKVIDFGLVQNIQQELEGSRAFLTQNGQSLYTPEYASPEQVQEEKLDERTDIFSLGMTLWFLLLGRMPCQGNLGMLLGERTNFSRNYADLLPPHINGEARRILSRMLEKELPKRYRYASEVLEDIDNLLDQLHVAEDDLNSLRGLFPAARTGASHSWDRSGESWTNHFRPARSDIKLTPGALLEVTAAGGKRVQLELLRAGLSDPAVTQLRKLADHLSTKAHPYLQRLLQVVKFREGIVAVWEMADGDGLLDAVRSAKSTGLAQVADFLGKAAAALDYAREAKVPSVALNAAEVILTAADRLPSPGLPLITRGWEALNPCLRPLLAPAQVPSTGDASGMTMAPGAAGGGMMTMATGGGLGVTQGFTSGFCGLIYLILSGRQPTMASYFSPKAMVRISTLSEGGNNFLSLGLAGQFEGERFCQDLLSELCRIEVVAYNRPKIDVSTVAQVPVGPDYGAGGAGPTAPPDGLPPDRGPWGGQDDSSSGNKQTVIIPLIDPDQNPGSSRNFSPSPLPQDPGERIARWRLYADDLAGKAEDSLAEVQRITGQVQDPKTNLDRATRTLEDARRSAERTGEFAREVEGILREMRTTAAELSTPRLLKNAQSDIKIAEEAAIAAQQAATDARRCVDEAERQIKLAEEEMTREFRANLDIQRSELLQASAAAEGATQFAAQTAEARRRGFVLEAKAAAESVEHEARAALEKVTVAKRMFSVLQGEAKTLGGQTSELTSSIGSLLSEADATESKARAALLSAQREAAECAREAESKLSDALQAAAAAARMALREADAANSSARAAAEARAQLSASRADSAAQRAEAAAKNATARSAEALSRLMDAQNIAAQCSPGTENARRLQEALELSHQAEQATTNAEAMADKARSDAQSCQGEVAAQAQQTAVDAAAAAAAANHRASVLFQDADNQVREIRETGGAAAKLSEVSDAARLAEKFRVTAEAILNSVGEVKLCVQSAQAAAERAREAALIAKTPVVSQASDNAARAAENVAQIPPKLDKLAAEAQAAAEKLAKAHRDLAARDENERRTLEHLANLTSEATRGSAEMQRLLRDLTQMAESAHAALETTRTSSATREVAEAARRAASLVEPASHSLSEALRLRKEVDVLVGDVQSAVTARMRRSADTLVQRILEASTSLQAAEQAPALLDRIKGAAAAAQDELNRRIEGDQLEQFAAAARDAASDANTEAENAKRYAMAAGDASEVVTRATSTVSAQASAADVVTAVRKAEAAASQARSSAVRARQAATAAEQLFSAQKAGSSRSAAFQAVRAADADAVEAEAAAEAAETARMAANYANSSAQTRVETLAAQERFTEASAVAEREAEEKRRKAIANTQTARNEASVALDSARQREILASTSAQAAAAASKAVAAAANLRDAHKEFKLLRHSAATAQKAAAEARDFAAQAFQSAHAAAAHAQTAGGITSDLASMAREAAVFAEEAKPIAELANHHHVATAESLAYAEKIVARLKGRRLLKVGTLVGILGAATLLAFLFWPQIEALFRPKPVVNHGGGGGNTGGGTSSNLRWPKVIAFPAAAFQSKENVSARLIRQGGEFSPIVLTSDKRGGFTAPAGLLEINESSTAANQEVKLEFTADGHYWSDPVSISISPSKDGGQLLLTPTINWSPYPGRLTIVSLEPQSYYSEVRLQEDYLDLDASAKSWLLEKLGTAHSLPPGKNFAVPLRLPRGRFRAVLSSAIPGVEAREVNFSITEEKPDASISIPSTRAGQRLAGWIKVTHPGTTVRKESSRFPEESATIIPEAVSFEPIVLQLPDSKGSGSCYLLARSLNYYDVNAAASLLTYSLAQRLTSYFIPLTPDGGLNGDLIVQRSQDDGWKIGTTTEPLGVFGRSCKTYRKHTDALNRWESVFEKFFPSRTLEACRHQFFWAYRYNEEPESKWADLWKCNTKDESWPLLSNRSSFASLVTTVLQGTPWPAGALENKEVEKLLTSSLGGAVSFLNRTQKLLPSYQALYQSPPSTQLQELNNATSSGLLISSPVAIDSVGADGVLKLRVRRSSNLGIEKTYDWLLNLRSTGDSASLKVTAERTEAVREELRKAQQTLRFYDAVCETSGAPTTAQGDLLPLSGP